MAEITKLKNAGFCTVKSVLMANMKDLCGIKGMGDAKAEKIRESAMKIEQGGFSSGKVILKKR